MQNDIINVILSVIKKTHLLALRNTVTIQFYSKYFYSKTNIEWVLLGLRKCVLSMLYLRVEDRDSTCGYDVLLKSIMQLCACFWYYNI